MAKKSSPPIKATSGNSGPTLDPIDPTGAIGRIPDWKNTVNSLNGDALTYAAITIGTIPGVGSPQSLVRKTLKDEAGKYVGEGKDAIMELMTLLNTPGSIKDDDIPKINKVIKTINRLIVSIENALTVLNTFAQTIFPIIGIITAAFIAARIIMMLPIPGAGLGAVVSFPQANFVATLIADICAVLLEVLKPIAFAIVAIMWMLIGVLQLLKILNSFALSVLDQMNDDLNSAVEDSLKTADDWASTGDMGDDSNALASTNFNDDGSSSNAQERLDLMQQINNIDSLNIGNDGLDGIYDGLGNGIGSDPPIGDEPDGVPPDVTSPYCNDNGECWVWSDDPPPGGWMVTPPSSIPDDPPSPYCYPGTNPLLCYGWLADPPPGGWNLLDIIECILPNGETQNLSPNDCLLAGGMYGGLVACLLPSGEIQHMSPEACAAAGGTYGMMDLVNCLLPDGTTQQMTAAACTAAGGSYGSNLLDYRDDLSDRLNNLGGPLDYGQLVITSVKHLHKDVTIEKAISKKGKRYGFYQSDISTRSIPTGISESETPEGYIWNESGTEYFAPPACLGDKDGPFNIIEAAGNGFKMDGVSGLTAEGTYVVVDGHQIPFMVSYFYCNLGFNSVDPDWGNCNHLDIYTTKDDGTKGEYANTNGLGILDSSVTFYTSWSDAVANASGLGCI
tara:strand:- start:2132 stop:4153 length:2022 start_codon:yes stop_codon:yes gene_type:complete